MSTKGGGRLVNAIGVVAMILSATAGKVLQPELTEIGRDEHLRARGPIRRARKTHRSHRRWGFRMTEFRASGA